MSPAPSLGERLNSNPCVMPGMPAWPKNRAYNDHRNAADVPSETSVSMVNAPWRRLIAAARWNGHAPHTTTGAARVRLSHCQLVNCSAGTMAIAITGIDRTAEMMTRWRSSSTRSGAAVSSVALPAWPVDCPASAPEPSAPGADVRG